MLDVEEYDSGRTATSPEGEESVEAEGDWSGTILSTKIVKLGYRIFEVPISYSPRSKSEGKKITYIDGFFVIKSLLKYKLSK